MTTTLTDLVPVRGPEYDKRRPETRQPWLDFRRPGITATQIRDWGSPNKRRQIIDEKVSGNFEDLSHLPYIAHGNRREPQIAAWVQGKFGIEPCEATYAHPENPRHLASPDGISRDPFTGQLAVGNDDALVLEIKTSKYNLHPGTIDPQRYLIEIEQGSKFDISGYYIQMQWQMYVMNATRTLFVWEQHDDIVDPETGTFTPIGPPEYVYVPRNDVLIDVLVNKVAPKALAEIDAALTALRTNELPPATDLPTEDMVTVMDLLAARQALATAEAQRDNALKTLQAKYVGPNKPDVRLDLGVANFTVSTSTPQAKTVTRKQFDEAAARKKAPALMKRYDELVEKFTTEVTEIVPAGEPVQRLTITEKKVKP